MLYGQWIGQIEGTNEGYVVLNVDRDRPAVGWLQVDDNWQPCSALMSINVDAQKVRGELIDWVAHGEPRPDLIKPTKGEFQGILSLDGKTLQGSWSTNAKTKGRFILVRAEMSGEREADKTMQWREFREWMLNDTEALNSSIFRGHSRSTYFLLTSFHRTGRRNLARYAREDMQTLRLHIEATLHTTYNMNDPDDLGGLMYLAQHHGFPTPLLDWSRSPFVAAYFAFSEVEETEEPQNVRILIFDLNEWPHGYVEPIGSTGPTFAPLILRATHNPRALPQQSVPMFSTVVDIDRFVELEEKQLNRRFLRRIDIPASERGIAMRELATMGITAAALFPGLDGVCRALKEMGFK